MFRKYTVQQSSDQLIWYPVAQFRSKVNALINMPANNHEWQYRILTRKWGKWVVITNP